MWTKCTKLPTFIHTMLKLLIFNHFLCSSTCFLLAAQTWKFSACCPSARWVVWLLFRLVVAISLPLVSYHSALCQILPSFHLSPQLNFIKSFNLKPFTSSLKELLIQKFWIKAQAKLMKQIVEEAFRTFSCLSLINFPENATFCLRSFRSISKRQQWSLYKRFWFCY